MPLQPRVGRGIHAHDHRVSGIQGRVDLTERRIARLTPDVGPEAYLRVDLADNIPANPRANKALPVLHFLVERPGGFRKSIAAEQHGNTRERAADIPNRFLGIGTKTKRVILPLRILLRKIDEIKSHVASL